MKIAIAHDYLIDFGGAERVLLALHEIYPDAPIYVSIYRASRLGKFAEKFKDAKIIQSWFGRIPFADRIISPLRFLLPAIWNGFDLKGFDLIISSSSWAVTKGFEKNSEAKEICYCHTPPRYLYGYDTSKRFTGIFGKLVKFYSLVVNHFMRQYDYISSQKVDYFIANSKEVQKRIEKFYKRDSVVIYPPVEIPGPKLPDPGVKSYYLTGGRIVAAKNFDLIVKVFNKLGLPLKIFGAGSMEGHLKSMAGNNIRFLGRISDEETQELYAGAKAFILAQTDEDFGMTSVEAMSFGTPVVAFKGGGYLESVVDGKTGIFFNEPTVESLTLAVKKFEKMKFKSEDCTTQAKKFSKERFKKEMLQFVNSYAGTS